MSPLRSTVRSQKRDKPSYAQNIDGSPHVVGQHVESYFTIDFSQTLQEKVPMIEDSLYGSEHMMNSFVRRLPAGHVYAEAHFIVIKDGYI